jgi:hypothetical protein
MKPRKKGKTHGKKVFTRPSQQKSVKNGRHQEKQVSKKKPSVKKVVKQIEKEIIPSEAELGFDDVELEDDMDFLDEEYGDESIELGEDVLDELDGVNYPDKEY